MDFGIYQLREKLEPIVKSMFKRYDGMQNNILNMPFVRVAHVGGRINVSLTTMGEASEASCSHALRQLDDALLILSYDPRDELSRKDKLASVVNRFFLPLRDLPGDLSEGVSRKETVESVAYLIDANAVIAQDKDSYVSCEHILLSEKVYFTQKTSHPKE
jgi:hypothetical protein